MRERDVSWVGIESIEVGDQFGGTGDIGRQCRKVDTGQPEREDTVENRLTRVDLAPTVTRYAIHNNALGETEWCGIVEDASAEPSPERSKIEEWQRSADE